MDTPARQALPDPVAIIAALMSMMTRFSCLGCPRIAARIRRNLTLLQHYADDEMPPPLKLAARRLEREWMELQLAISDIPEASKAIKATSEPTAESTLVYPASQSLH
ncbi:MAG: hypothetical protein E6Q44_02460 [Flavobacteriales bacterium]|nr:MAG: hypothetical protein E6Q44_02460 [Flavobacteriales bacterium]